MTAATITNVGHNLLRDSMSGASVPLIKYVALGTSSTSPTVNDTTLGTESFRKSVTSYANGASVGELLVNMYLAPGDDIGDTIAEIGFFGGTSATNAANTGVLFAHGLYTHNPKVGTESIQFVLDVIA